MMDHINWSFEIAVAKGHQYNITGIDYDLTLGTVKNIIPAVASTNETIASICINKAFKYFTKT
jgi:ubiquitin-activating enzyme E1 C